MRPLTVTQCVNRPGRRHHRRREEPKPGSALRAAWDALQAGEAIPLGTTQRFQLEVMYGLDVVMASPPGRGRRADGVRLWQQATWRLRG